MNALFVTMCSDLTVRNFSGGDGPLRGAFLIAEEVKSRGLKIAVVGVPKTIDNDIPIIDKSFGFETAVEEVNVIFLCSLCRS